MIALRHLLLVGSLVAACAGGSTPEPTATPDASPPPADDGAPPPDAAPPTDTSPPPDTAAAPDASTGIDPMTTMPGHENLPVDNSPKRGPRMMPVESYVRSYLLLFGGLSPTGQYRATPLQVAAQARAAAPDLFDTWNDYLATLGLPDHRVDLPRNTQMNALMLATLERTGMALCDLAVRRELEAAAPVPVADRAVFAFERPATGTLPLGEFATRFDVLHRTFLGYPAALAPEGRIQRFYDLYAAAAARPAAARPTRFAPAADAGWAVVCYGLLRHPEFHLY